MSPARPISLILTTYSFLSSLLFFRARPLTGRLGPGTPTRTLHRGEHAHSISSFAVSAIRARSQEPARARLLPHRLPRARAFSFSSYAPCPSEPARPASYHSHHRA